MNEHEETVHLLDIFFNESFWLSLAIGIRGYVVLCNPSISLISLTFDTVITGELLTFLTQTILFRMHS